MVVVIQLVKGRIGKKVVDPRNKKVVLIQLVKGSIGPTGEKFVLV